jgi:N-acetylglucosaminyl-diphospho-decaprenol L-rhamnosyltransferase
VSAATSAPFTVVVVNYGSHDLLRTTLTATLATDPAARAVVVDNLSTASERAALRALADEQGWAVELPAANLGFGGGMNVGVARAIAEGATRVLLLNPDAVVRPGGLAALGAALDADPMTMAAPVVLRPDGTPYAAGTTDLSLRDGTMRSTRRRPPGSTTPVLEWLSGACLALTADLWAAVGGFDERYFLYWEDVDLSLRVQRAGGSLTVVDDAQAVHDEGATHDDATASRAKSATYYYFNIRNRLLFAALHLDAAHVRRWVLTAPRAAWAVLLQGGRRQLVAGLSPWRSAVRGTWDGLALLVGERGVLLRRPPTAT